MSPSHVFRWELTFKNFDFFFASQRIDDILQRNSNRCCFYPPPVDKGEAPIHINRRVRNQVDGRREVRSTVLKPAVRGVTALKKDTASFPLNGSPLRQLLFSDNQKSKVPPTRSSKVAVMTIRVVVFTILTCDGIRFEEPVSR